MKKLFAVLLMLSMLLASASLMTFTTQAVDIPGDWTTYRAAAEYPAPGEDTTGKVYKPEAGYEYTEEGFTVIPADYTDSTPFMTVQTKEPQPIQEGVYMEFRVDDYCYNGPEHNIDSWICISITNQPKVTPGAPAYGGGWMCLIRGNGGGADAKAESCNTVENVSFQNLGASTVTPGLDSEGRELYTFEASYNNSQYTFKLNGVTLNGMPQISGNLKNLDPKGNFYVGVTLYSSMKDGTAALSILNYGTSKSTATPPQGSDTKDPEPNLIKVAPIADPSTVPENQPALYWDASVAAAPNGTNLFLSPLGDNAFRVQMSDNMGYFNWNMSRSLSYSGTDFPIFTVLFRNYYGDGGGLWYYGGDVLGAVGDNNLSWSSYDNGIYYEGEEDEYILLTLDLSNRWEGRINGLRFDLTAPEVAWEYDICYMGFFRSQDEAEAFCESRLTEWGVEVGTDEAETSESDENQPQETEPQETEPQETEPQETQPQETESIAETDAETVTNTEESSATAETDAPEEKKGCGASLSGAMLVGAVMLAAGICMRKKED